MAPNISNRAVIVTNLPVNIEAFDIASHFSVDVSRVIYLSGKNYCSINVPDATSFIATYNNTNWNGNTLTVTNFTIPDFYQSNMNQPVT